MKLKQKMVVLCKTVLLHSLRSVYHKQFCWWQASHTFRKEKILNELTILQYKTSINFV